MKFTILVFLPSALLFLLALVIADKGEKAPPAPPRRPPEGISLKKPAGRVPRVGDRPTKPTARQPRTSRDFPEALDDELERRRRAWAEEAAREPAMQAAFLLVLAFPLFLIACLATAIYWGVRGALWATRKAGAG